MASNIDNLNFKVILDDKDFNTRVEKDIELAKKLNVELSQLLQAKVKVNSISATEAASAKRASDILTKQATNQEKISQAKAKTAEAEEKVATQAAKTAKELERGKTAASQTAVNVQRLATEQQRTEAATQNAAAATSRAALAQKRLADYSKQTTNSIRSQSRLMNELKGYALGYLSIHGATQLISSLVRVTGEFELQKTTLAAMLGDLNEAEQIITRIQGLAVESPFQFKELTTYAKQLSAFSVPAEELYETTKMLADVSAGLGVGMDRIVLAYGQVRSAAFLRGQEVRQFTEAGIPILDELAKQFTELEGRAVSTGEVFDKISARLVPFEMVAKVFKDMTSEGGKFYEMQEVQAETLRGKISNLKDAYEVMLNEIGSGQSEKLKGAVDWARKLMQNYESVGKEIVALIATFGAYKVTLALVSNLHLSFARNLVVLRKGLNSLTAALSANPYVALAAAIAAVGYATYKLVTYQTEAEKIQKSVVESHEDYTESLAKEYATLNRLYGKLELCTEGTLEHDKAKAQIMRKYSTYIDQLREEGVEVNNLADIYVNLADKIRESMQVKFFDTATQGIEQAFKDAQDKAAKALTFSISAQGDKYDLTEKDKLALNLYVMGAYDQEKAFKNMSESAKQYFSDFNFFLNQQRKKMKESTDAYMEGLDEISDAYQTFQKENEKPPIDLTKFAESVQNVLKSFGATEESKGIFSHLWADNKTEYYGYLKDLREGYEEIKQKIKDVGTTQKENLPDLEKQKKAIESIAKALGVSLDKGDSGKGKSKAQIDLETQIDLVKKLQDAYDKLRPYVDDKTMKSTLSKFFPDAKQEWIDSLDFTTVLKSLADELEKYDKDAAERLRNAIGKTGIEGEIDRLENLEKGYKETAKAAKEYFNQLRKWKSEDFNLEGEGIAFDIDKISTNLSSKINEINVKTQKTKELFDQIGISDTSKRDEKAVKKVKEIFEKEFGKGSWDAFYEEFLSKGEAAFKTLADKEVAYEKKIAQEKINNLANSYVSDLTQGLDLSDWSDKSIGQIQFIREKLAALMSSDLPISDSLKSELTQLGLSTDSLIAKIKELLGGKYDMATLEKIKAVQDAAKEVSSYAKSSGEALSSLGDALNSDILKGAGKVVGYIGKMADAIMESESMMAKLALAFGDLDNMSEEARKNLENIAESSDWITMVVKVILTAVTAIGNVIAKQRENLELAVDAAIAYREALADIARENSETIFGTSEISVLVTNLKAASEAAKEFRSELDKVMSADRGVGGWYLPSLGGEGGEGFNFTTIRDLQTLLKGKDFKSEKEMMEYLKANIEMWEGWSHLSDGIRTTSQLETEIKNLIKMYEAWDKTNEQVKASLTDLFGQLGNDIATNMINSFIEVGKATDNLEESFQSLGQTILETFLQSAIIDDILMPKIDELSSMLTSVATGGMSLEEFGERLAATTNDLKAQIEAIAPGWEMIFQTWQKEGLLPTEGGGTSDLGEGIKGITEDTASLLASYINAMRADLSMMRGMQAKYLPIIGESMPTLLDYLARIQANTFDLAQSNAEILQETQKIVFELQSVMGFGDEGRAIRILS